MKHISSRDNKLFKELKDLASQAATRKKLGKSILDGVHLCQAFLERCGAPEILVVAESALQIEEVKRICLAAEKRGAQAISFPDALFQNLSQVENGIGLAFVVPTPKPVWSGALTANAVVLDGVQDPGNLGSILRSAAGAGIQTIFCGVGTASAWSPKVLRAGMGAHFLLTIFEAVDLPGLLAATNIPILATSSHTQTTIYQVDLRQAHVWLFGHEGQGVSPELMALASQQVTIPQNPALESLNVAASAAICFFEQVRQNLD